MPFQPPDLVEGPGMEGSGVSHQSLWFGSGPGVGRRTTERLGSAGVPHFRTFAPAECGVRGLLQVLEQAGGRSCGGAGGAVGAQCSGWVELRRARRSCQTLGYKNLDPKALKKTWCVVLPENKHINKTMKTSRHV